jgi:hypothetical protein
MERKMSTTIEVKIKMNGQKTKWENIKRFGAYQKHDLHAVLSTLRQADNVYEIRWNYLNSPQGHYVRGFNAKFPWC